MGRNNGTKAAKATKAKATPKPREELVEALAAAPEKPKTSIWVASDGRHMDLGYLVTEPGKIDRPLCFVPMSNWCPNEFDITDTAAKETAEECAADPEIIGNRPVIDLRGCGYPDSRTATPPWLWGLYCVPVDDEEGEMVNPRPFCPQLFDWFIGALAEMRTEGGVPEWIEKMLATSRPHPWGPKASRHAKETGWEDCDFPTNEGEVMEKRLPLQRVTALARPGMVIQPPNEFDYAIIETVTADFCLIRFENGHVDALRWGQVFLYDVQPDPAFITDKASKVA